MLERAIAVISSSPGLALFFMAVVVMAAVVLLLVGGHRESEADGAQRAELIQREIDRLKRERDTIQ